MGGMKRRIGNRGLSRNANDRKLWRSNILRMIHSSKISNWNKKKEILIPPEVYIDVSGMAL